MAPILSCHPGSLNAFALKLKRLSSIALARRGHLAHHADRSRVAASIQRQTRSQRFALGRPASSPYPTMAPTSSSSTCGAMSFTPSTTVRQTLARRCEAYLSLMLTSRPERFADDDFEAFLARHQNSPEVTVLLSSLHIPTQNPSLASVSSLPPSSAFSSSSTGAGGIRADPDASSLYSSRSYLYGRSPDAATQRSSRRGQQVTSLHLVVPEASANAGDTGSVRSRRSGRSSRSMRSVGSEGADTIGTKTRRGLKGLEPSIPEHKIKFEEFHNQVRTLF